MRRTKTTKVSIKAPPQNIFKATKVKDPIYNRQEEIDKAAKQLEAEAAEAKLLEAELAKPFSARNKAVVEKYGQIDPESVIDSYPKLNQGILYRIVERFPENRDIGLDRRPKKWFTQNEFAYRGNVFIFEFPLYYHGEIGGDRSMKLDHDGTVVDVNGVVVDETFGLLAAIVAWLGKNDTYSALIKKIFLKYGILKEEDDEGSIFTNQKLDFCVRGHNVYVKYTVIPGTKVADVLKHVEKPDVVQHVKFAEGGLDFMDIDTLMKDASANPKTKKTQEATFDKTFDKYVEKIRSEGLKFPGISTPLDNILVTGLYNPIKYPPRGFLYNVFDRYDSESGEIKATVVVTKDLADKLLGFTSGKLITNIAAQNQKVYNDYLAASK